MNLKTITKLTPIQKEALQKFKKLKVGALFMDMGIGKTRVALELIYYNIEKIDYILWLTPCSTKKNLFEEIKKWNFPFEVDIMGYETISQSTKKYLQLLERIKNKKLFIVADESIFIKNEDTKRYSRIKEIAKKSEYRIILNGTPLTKNEWDIYNQMLFLSPKIINMSRGEFLETFYKKIRYKRKGEKENSFHILSDINIDYLHRLINPYILYAEFIFPHRTIKKSVLCYPDLETLDKYNNSKDDLLGNFSSGKLDIIKLLVILNKISAEDKNKAKEIAKYIKDKRVIVFCNFINEVKLIGEQLKNKFIITGNIKQKDRDVIIDEFKTENIPLIMTTGTGSFGLNLQEANEIVFSSLTFDYSKVEQASKRIRRLGQKSDIKYTYFDIDLPINEYIARNLDKKEYLNELIIKKLEENNAEKILK